MPPEQEPKHETLLVTLQRLLELPTTNVGDTLNHSAQLVAAALHAEKVDAFLYDPPSESLIAFGTSETPMGTKQKVLGLDQLPLAQGGRVVEVYQTGHPYWSGQVHHDPAELPGMKTALGIKSEILVPLSVDGTPRGVILASASTPEHFTEEDLHFLEAVTHWIGVVIHHVELTEQHTQVAVDQAHRLAAEEILTVMAHDLGNQLTPLIMRLNLLERRARCQGQAVYERDLFSIDQAIMQLQRLVTDLLDVARLRQGLFSLEVQAFDLVELLQELESVWSIPEHPLELHAPDHLIVVADQNRIRQALDNLLSNATTHADPGTAIQVMVSEEHRSEGPWVLVTVSNQGPPMAPDLLPTLFLPFAKGAQSQGMGLGLYLAERIAYAHHGTLTVRTAAEPATTSFVLSWPCTPDDDQAKHPSHAG